MKLLFALLVIVATVSSAPQEPGLNTQDAELIPSVVTKGSTNRNTNQGGLPDGVNVHVVRIPSFSLLDMLFGNNRPGVRTPQTTNRDPQGGDDLFTRFFGGGGDFFPFRFPRPVFSDIPFPDFPTISNFPDFADFPNMTSFDDLPDGYNNSTYDVKDVNGTRVEVNRTISKSDNNDTFFRTVIVRVTPDRNGANRTVVPSPLPSTVVPKTVENTTIPEDDPRNNQVQTEPYENFGNQTTKGLTRRRRWITEYIRRALARSKANSNPPSNSLSAEDIEEITHTRSKPLSTRLLATPLGGRNDISLGNDISLVGDTDVNYIVGAVPRDNPDAEVFDADLIRADAERFYERNPRPLRSRSIASSLVMSQPVRTQPIRTAPVRTQPIRTAPL